MRIYYGILLNAGIFIVDSMHFQYNAMLIGLSLLSIHMIEKKRYLMGALLYVVLIFLKHIFLYFVTYK